MKDMGLALEMTPNYEDFSCQVRNGRRYRSILLLCR